MIRTNHLIKQKVQKANQKINQRKSKQSFRKYLQRWKRSRNNNYSLSPLSILLQYLLLSLVLLILMIFLIRKIATLYFWTQKGFSTLSHIHFSSTLFLLSLQYSVVNRDNSAQSLQTINFCINFERILATSTWMFLQS